MTPTPTLREALYRILYQSSGGNDSLTQIITELSARASVEALARVISAECYWRTVYMGHALEVAEIERVTVERMATAIRAHLGLEEG